MIYNKTTNYATVWKIKNSESGKYMDLDISTSEKDKENENQYINSYWNVRVLGHALNSLKALKERDKIEFSSSKFSKEKYEDREGNIKYALKILIFEAQIQDPNSKDDKTNTETKPSASATKTETKSATKSKPKDTTNKEGLPW